MGARHGRVNQVYSLADGVGRWVESVGKGSKRRGGGEDEGNVGLQADEEEGCSERQRRMGE
jgi:hypothetical protein